MWSEVGFSVIPNQIYMRYYREMEKDTNPNTGAFLDTVSEEKRDLYKKYSFTYNETLNMGQDNFRYFSEKIEEYNIIRGNNEETEIIIPYGEFMKFILDEVVGNKNWAVVKNLAMIAEDLPEGGYVLLFFMY
jgi:hypothetical protein